MLNHFTTSPLAPTDSATGVVAPRGFEPRLTDSKSAVLPLDEGADAARSVPSGARRASGAGRRRGQRNGAEDGTRTRDPHLGKVMLYQLSHFRSGLRAPGFVGAESQSRTGDTAIFSRVLYQLSYLGPASPPGRSGPTARRRLARALSALQSRPVVSTGPCRAAVECSSPYTNSTRSMPERRNRAAVLVESFVAIDRNDEIRAAVAVRACRQAPVAHPTSSSSYMAMIVGTDPVSAPVGRFSTAIPRWPLNPDRAFRPVDRGTPRGDRWRRRGPAALRRRARRAGSARPGSPAWPRSGASLRRPGRRGR